MYKYRYNNQIHSVPGFQEARKQSGLALPAGMNPISHFIVRIWQWDDNDDDFSIEVFDTPGHSVFDEYDDALTCFNTLVTHYPGSIAEEIKLELVQYHRGKITTYYSRILFPSLLAGQL